MKFSKLVLSHYSSGHIWPWGKAGNVITVGDRGTNGATVTKIESHPDGFMLVTARQGEKSMQSAVMGEGHATCCDGEPQCEVCGQFFANSQGLAQHVKTHAQPVKQVTEKNA